MERSLLPRDGTRAVCAFDRSGDEEAREYRESNCEECLAIDSSCA